MDEQTSQKGIDMDEQQAQVDTSAAFQVVNEGSFIVTAISASIVPNGPSTAIFCLAK